MNLSVEFDVARAGGKIGDDEEDSSVQTMEAEKVLIRNRILESTRFRKEQQFSAVK